MNYLVNFSSLNDYLFKAHGNLLFQIYSLDTFPARLHFVERAGSGQSSRPSQLSWATVDSPMSAMVKWFPKSREPGLL